MPEPTDPTPSTAHPVSVSSALGDGTPITGSPQLYESSQSAFRAIDKGIIRVAAVDGRDPLVKKYLHAHRATCAAHPVSYTWVLIGLLAVIGGAIIANMCCGHVNALPGERSAIAQWFNHFFGNSRAVMVGMCVGGIIASFCGAYVNRRIPAGQEPLLVAFACMVLYLPIYDPLVGIGALIGAMTLVYLVSISFRVVALLAGGYRGMRSEVVQEPSGGWPIYTVLVPLYHERAIAGTILASLKSLDYPREKLDVKFLLEADDTETLPALLAAGIPTWAEVVIVPMGQPRTKPRACNHGLDRARGEYLVIFDAEDRPEPDQLKQSVLAFAQLAPHVVCLQAQLAYRNHNKNILTRWFALEYNVWFRRYLPGLVRLGSPIPLGGTSNHFRTAALTQLGGWDPFNVTEDCDLGVRLHMQGLRTVTLDSTTWEEATSSLGNWLRQRSRWIKGYFITHLVWARQPLNLLLRLGPWGTFCFVCSVGTFAALSVLNLGLWVTSTVQLIFISIDLSHGHRLIELLTTRDLAHERWSWPMWYSGAGEDPISAWWSQIFCIAAIVMIAGNIFFIAVNMLAGRRPQQRGLWWAALISPLYWLLISVAALKGVWQLITKPHYWEKTVHELNDSVAQRATDEH